MGRLRRDTRGNVLAMTAAAIIPLLAMIGGAIDASRIYMAYPRLQQACASGAIAGRKAMSNVTTLPPAERQKAEEFFDFNFPQGTYQADDWTRTFAKGADGVVTGAAATAIMLFGYTSVLLAVTCEATLNIPNTDVMFVLDVTGSMRIAQTTPERVPNYGTESAPSQTSSTSTTTSYSNYINETAFYNFPLDQCRAKVNERPDTDTVPQHLSAA